MTTTEQATELVLTERHHGVLTITTNRPAQKNAINREVAVQLASALDLLDADPPLSVGVDARQQFPVSDPHRLFRTVSPWTWRRPGTRG